MILAILVFSSCFGKTDIIGKWKVVEPSFFKNTVAKEDKDYVRYVFMKDNSFILFIPTFKEPRKGTFSISEDTLTLTLDNTEGNQIYDIAHSSSSELILKRKDDGFVMRMTL